MLVVGATRALRPAVSALVADGHDVFGLARTVRLHGVTPVEADWTDVPALRAALAELRFDAALLYCPTASTEAVAVIRSTVDGRAVQLLPSAVAAPPFTLADLPVDGAVHVVLGWTDERAWHTPEQLSDAALDALRTGTDRVLGTVSPWSDRPS